MKKYIIIMLLTLGITSCNYKEDDPFESEGTALQRTNNQLEQYKRIIEADDSYWVLSVFPGNNRSFQGLPVTNQGLGGYNFVVKYKNGKVYASSEMEADNTERESYFSYLVTSAPVFSFDTYNKILHHFYQSSTRYPRGRGGDVEYLIRKEENSVFSLEGRFSQNKMLLTKLTTDRETFLNTVRENVATLRTKGLEPIQINGVTIELTMSLSYRQVVFSYGETKVQESFVVTDKGLRFYKPVTINGVTIEELYINDAKTALITSDNTITINFANSPITINRFEFNSNYNNEISGGNSMWFIQDFVSQDLLDQYSQATTSVQSRYSNYNMAMNTRMDFGIIPGNDTSQAFCFHKFVSLENNSWWGSPIFQELDVTGVGGHPNQVAITVTEPAYNDFFFSGYYYTNNVDYQYFPEVVQLFRYIGGKSPYTVEEATIDGRDYYLLISTKDTNTWFYVTK